MIYQAMIAVDDVCCDGFCSSIMYEYLRVLLQNHGLLMQRNLTSCV